MKILEYKTGWIIATPETERIIADGLMIILPDDTARDPLEFLILDEAGAWAAIRAERDRLLAAFDWTQVADAPLSDAQRAVWATYRQALRDIPRQYSNPAGVVWPEPPTATQLRQARLAEDRPAFISDTTMED